MSENLVSRYVVCALVVLLAAWALSANWPLNLGIDLQGGFIFTYSVEPVHGGGEDARASTSEIDDVVRVISQRFDQVALRDLNVRKEGSNRIALQLPGLHDRNEIERIKEQMTQLGDLKFLIAAYDGLKLPDGSTFNAETEKKRREDLLKAGKAWTPPPGVRWHFRYPQQKSRAEVADWRDQCLREPWKQDGSFLYYDPEFWASPSGATAEEYRLRPGFTGEHIANPRTSADEIGNRAVAYDVIPERRSRFESYTQRYVGKPMAIVLNDEIWSEPTIQEKLSDSVRITGGAGGFSEAEQKWLIDCLQSGSLKLRVRFEQGVEIGASLGEETVRRALVATAIAFAAVLLFMLWYYRGTGIVACIALVLNLGLLIACLALFQATLTLPGIAGTILSVAMAVDANVLIFERMKEEIQKGKAIPHAMQNGYNRAFLAIFDSNLTTILTAILLYQFGVGPIRGFAVTLIAGITISMFTQLYVTRTLLGFALRHGLFTKLRMMNLFAKPNFDFMGKRRPVVIASAALTVVGITTFILTGSSKYGLDFNGGTVLRVAFTKPVPIAEVKAKVASVRGSAGGSKYGAPEVNTIDDGLPHGPAESALFEIKLDYVAPSPAGAGGAARDEFEDVKTDMRALFGDALAPDGVTGLAAEEGGRWAMTLNFTPERGVEPPAPPAVERTLTEVLSDVRVTEAPVAGLAVRSFRVTGGHTATRAADVDALVKRALNGDRSLGRLVASPFPKVDSIGPNVVAELKKSALVSIFLSCVMIALYLWFRFRELRFGIAAVVALIHDVAVTVGLVILFDQLGLVSAKINLPVVAAFLTIIGYSVNDTIVLFDRIRENLGQSGASLTDIANRSANETLSRTIWTGAMTLFALLVMFIVNYGQESALEGFAFALIIGILCGTYSSIYVATPVVLWLNDRAARKTAARDAAIHGGFQGAGTRTGAARRDATGG